MHPRWPFVADRLSQQAVRDVKPFPVSSCWNGAVVFNSAPFLFGSNSPDTPSTTRNLWRRGWRRLMMVCSLPLTCCPDTDESASDGFAQSSPPVELPLQFRPSNIEACDHSEAFLPSYDLHRLYADIEARPRILMNPAVQVAYVDKWYHWNNVILRYPIVKWWTSQCVL